MKPPDQRFSYVDCVSIAIMRRRGIREAFAFDDDFVKIGFTVVPGTE